MGQVSSGLTAQGLTTGILCFGEQTGRQPSAAGGDATSALRGWFLMGLATGAGGRGECTWNLKVFSICLIY